MKPEKSREKLFSDEITGKIRKIIKEKLESDNAELISSQEYEEIHNLLSRTLLEGESNSVLLIGPRNCGKTTLIEQVLIRLKPHFVSSGILIRLNGLVHTEAKTSLEVIAKSMGLENVIDGKVFGSFADNLVFLLDSLKTGNRTRSKSVIFILEEFDLFCMHHNQTLLYNLFDISQSAQTPVCVVGLTSRFDVIELLEKRVKSRFSHRQFFLLMNGINSESRLKRIENLISIHSDVIDNNVTNLWNKEVATTISDKNFVWNVERMNNCAPSEKTWKNLIFKTISNFNSTNNKTLLEMFLANLNEYLNENTLVTLKDLNVLELCLLISMKHHSEIYDEQIMNFEMVFQRFLKFSQSNSTLNIPQKCVVMKAFEHLQDLELISSCGGIGALSAGVQKEYQLFKLLVLPQHILEATKITGLPTEVVQWAAQSPL